MAAQRKKPNSGPEPGSTQSSAVHLEKVTKLLALLVVKGEAQNDKIKVLSSAGFTNTEIAELLGITANTVNVTIHRLRARR